MSHPKKTPQTRRRWALASLLLSVAFYGLHGNQVSAQSDRRGPAPVVNQSANQLGQSHTPKQVLNGTAVLAGRLSPSTPIHLVLGVARPKMAEEEQFLKELQDPKSPNFHKYLTAAQWNARFSPSAKDEQAIVDWATSNGLTVTQRFANRLIIDVDGTSENVEKAFGVTMNSYLLNGATEFSNDRDPVIPTYLANVLHSVSGLNSIQRLQTPRGGSPDPKNSNYSVGESIPQGSTAGSDGNKAAFEAAMKASDEAKASKSAVSLKQPTPAAGSQPGITSGFIDPTDIYSAYGYDFNALQNQGHCCNPSGNSNGSTPATSIAIATSGAINFNDIAGFKSRYNYLAYLVTYINVDGNYTCNNSSGNDDSCVETTLDTEWALATANSFGSQYTTSHVFVYQAVNSGLGTFTDMFNRILSDGNARVMSTSWSCGEFDCYDSGTMDTDDGIFASMVGQGWTLLGDSDDQGSAGDCNGGERVTYPASDPHVVAVGGTSLAFYSDGTFDSEQGWQGATYSGACKQNNGGSGGGCSTKYAAPSYQFNSGSFCGSSGRSVPDISLNAGYGQNVYYNGNWYGYGGTSIATPQTAGFMAQANSYLMALGTSATIGQANYELWYFAQNPTYAQHYPYYDMVGGCNNNDITAAYGLGYFCAVSGYDRVTGWGSYNALQMAWAMNAYFLGDFAAPTVTFSGPSGISSSYYTFFNTDQTVSWTVTDNGSGGLAPTGVSGYSAGWDTAFSDPTTASARGTSDSFYNGPLSPRATTGSLDLASAGEGCHYATVDSWDNSGYTSGNQYFYWICYDITPPVTTASLSGNAYASHYNGPVTVTLSATDAKSGVNVTSGVANTYYQVDGGSVKTYSGPFTISTASESHTVVFHSVDKAGNVESSKSISFKEYDATATTLTSSENPAPAGTTVKFTATVTSSAGTPTGTVEFVDGSTELGTGTLSGGVATYSTSNLAVATHSIKAEYLGAWPFGQSNSSTLSEVILHTSTTAVTSNLNPAPLGGNVTFTATVTSPSGTPTGNVQFLHGSTVMGTVALSGGKATYTTNSLTEGTKTITAIYQGDSAHYKSTSPVLDEVIDYTTTSAVVSSENPAPTGAKVTFTATVTSSSGTPTGNVQFLHGTTVFATVALSGGKASASISDLEVGARNITVQYEGDSTHYKSTSPALVETIKTATTSAVTSSKNPAALGANVTFTATVTSSGGTPTGNVEFLHGTTVMGTVALSGGKATFTTNSLTAGTKTITVIYQGNSTYFTSTSPVLDQVIQ